MIHFNINLTKIFKNNLLGRKLNEKKLIALNNGFLRVGNDLWNNKSYIFDTLRNILANDVKQYVWQTIQTYTPVMRVQTNALY